MYAGGGGDMRFLIVDPLHIDKYFFISYNRDRFIVQLHACLFTDAVRLYPSPVRGLRDGVCLQMLESRDLFLSVSQKVINSYHSMQITAIWAVQRAQNISILTKYCL